MGNPLDFIRLEALTLAEGENTRDITCPFCPPYDQEKASLSVTRNADGLLYQCYRAKCGSHGFIPTISNFSLYTTVKKVKSKVNSFEHEVSKLTDAQYKRLILNYNLTVDEIDTNSLKWSATIQRLAIPLFDKNYMQWGWEAKVIKGLTTIWHKPNTGIKSIVYPSIEGKNRLYYPKLSPEYVRERTGIAEHTVVLVEDVMSAIRVMRYRDSVALLGCSLNMEQVIELMEGYPNVVVALDPDATDKAIKMKKEYAGYFNTFRVMQLNKDPKDMNEEELEREFLTV